MKMHEDGRDARVIKSSEVALVTTVTARNITTHASQNSHSQTSSEWLLSSAVALLAAEPWDKLPRGEEKIVGGNQEPPTSQLIVPTTGKENAR